LSSGNSLVPRERDRATLEQTGNDEGEECGDDDGHSRPDESTVGLCDSETKVQDQDCDFGGAHDDIIDGFAKVEELSMELMFGYQS
jgi:hypothetical protein